MDDPVFERFRVTARRHRLEEPPAEVRQRLLGILSPRAPTTTPLRQIIAVLVQDLAGSAAVAGARGGGGTRQLLHR